MSKLIDGQARRDPSWRTDGVFDFVSRASAWLGAIALLAATAFVSAQIVSRLFGYQIVGTDDLAAWSMAGIVFLSLPHTLKAGAHIRVTLLLQALPPRMRAASDLVANAVALCLVAWAAWHCTAFVLESYRTHEMSQGMIVIPIWLPQLSMPIGLVGLLVMLLGRLLNLLEGTPWPEHEHE